MPSVTDFAGQTGSSRARDVVLRDPLSTAGFDPQETA
jgi:hypothetical protein